jgi:hypothetical protein
MLARRGISSGVIDWRYYRSEGSSTCVRGDDKRGHVHGWLGFEGGGEERQKHMPSATPE